jgi:signal peptidase II
MDNALDDSVASGERDAAATPRRHLEVWLPMVIVAVDQATKAMVRANLHEHDSVTLIPGFVDLTHVLNNGTAFGFLNGVEFPFKGLVIAIIAAAALIGVGVYAASLAHHQWVARLGLALIIGGAAGNLLDRVVAGSVVDFVDVYWRTHHFWAFNVADSAISIGVAIMILDMLGAERDPGAPARSRGRDSGAGGTGIL